MSKADVIEVEGTRITHSVQRRTAFFFRFTFRGPLLREDGRSVSAVFSLTAAVSSYIEGFLPVNNR